MATIKSEKVTLNSSAENVYDKLCNPENLRDLLNKVPIDQVPEDKRDLLTQISVTSDSITIPGGPTGPITLKMTEKVRPTLLKLEGEGTPVALFMSLHLIPMGDLSEATIEIDIAVPALVLPMVKGPLQKLADQVANTLRAIAIA